MTRENKAGLAVCGAFLCLAGTVAFLKWQAPAVAGHAPGSPTLAMASEPPPAADKADPVPVKADTPPTAPAVAPVQPSTPPETQKAPEPVSAPAAPALPPPPSGTDLPSLPPPPAPTPAPTVLPASDHSPAPPPAPPGADAAPALPPPAEPNDLPPVHLPPVNTPPPADAAGAQDHQDGDKKPKKAAGDDTGNTPPTLPGLPPPPAPPAPPGPPPAGPTEPPPGPTVEPAPPLPPPADTEHNTGDRPEKKDHTPPEKGNVGDNAVHIPAGPPPAPLPPIGDKIEPPPASVVAPPPVQPKHEEVHIPATPPVRPVAAEPPAPSGAVIAATPGATGVRPTTPQPPAYPNVDSWDEKTYVCKPGDDFAAIAERAYPGHGEEYAAALQMYNRNHPRAGDAMRRDGTVAPGDRVYIPQSPAVLEKRHGDAISRSKPKPVAGLSGGDPGAMQTSFQTVAPTPPPAALPPVAGPAYTVAAGGESLLQIAKRVLGSDDRWPEIAKLNQGVNAESPVPAGTKLRLPPSAHVPSN